MSFFVVFLDNYHEMLKACRHTGCYDHPKVFGFVSANSVRGCSKVFCLLDAKSRSGRTRQRKSHTTDAPLPRSCHRKLQHVSRSLDTCPFHRSRRLPLSVAWLFLDRLPHQLSQLQSQQRDIIYTKRCAPRRRLKYHRP